ncbi:hypothetical protein P7C70_g2000, partial [Phenoliferia sp. Uapishka_3]
MAWWKPLVAICGPRKVVESESTPRAAPAPPSAPGPLPAPSSDSDDDDGTSRKEVSTPAPAVQEQRSPPLVDSPPATPTFALASDAAATQSTSVPILAPTPRQQPNLARLNAHSHSISLSPPTPVEGPTLRPFVLPPIRSPSPIHRTASPDPMVPMAPESPFPSQPSPSLSVHTPRSLAMHKHQRTSSAGSRSFKETLNAFAADGHDGTRSVNQYILKEKLGQGSYATVERATDRTTHLDYAVKEFSKARMKKQAAMEASRGPRGRGPRGRPMPVKAEVVENPDEAGPANLSLVRSEVAIMKKVARVCSFLSCHWIRSNDELLFDDRVTYPDTFSPSLVSLLQKMLCRDPAKRITPAEMWVDPWVTEDGANPLPCSYEENNKDPIVPPSEEELDAALLSFHQKVLVARAANIFRNFGRKATASSLGGSESSEGGGGTPNPGLSPTPTPRKVPGRNDTGSSEATTDSGVETPISTPERENEGLQKG